MKHCKMCARVLPLSEFSMKSNTTRTPCSYCKECQRQYSRQHYRANKALHNERRYANQKRYYQENRKRLVVFLSDKSCVDCGEDDVAVLDFDHVHGTKTFNISHMIGRFGWARIEQEIQKCEIRCANCHRRKTAQDFKWFKADYGA